MAAGVLRGGSKATWRGGEKRGVSNPGLTRDTGNTVLQRQLFKCLCSTPKGGAGPGSALRHVDADPSTKRPDARIVPRAKPASH